MAGSTTTLIESSQEGFPSSQLLLSSLDPRSSPRKIRSEISKVYKEASELFLTRRFAEALSTIEPIITVPGPPEGTAEEENTAAKALIAKANPKSRTKLWVLYLGLLNAIVELDPEDGKAAFGSKAWRQMVEKVQDGTTWDEIVEIGYGGVEGRVDADVVASLARLLLAQSPSQTSNQQHLESYLSTSDNINQDQVDRSIALGSTNGGTNDEVIQSNGIHTPQGLDSRVKIIELYTLHVLPRNGEFEYARQFVNLSEALDEDTREIFIQDLLDLEKQESGAGDKFHDALPQQRNLIDHNPKPAENMETDSIDTVQAPTPNHHHRSNSEKDYGIENVRDSKQPTPKSKPPQEKAKPIKLPKSKPSRSSPIRTSNNPVHSSVYQRSLAMMSALQHIISKLAEQMSRNPMGLLRFVLFLLGLVMAFSRRDVKDKLGSFTGASWDKVKRTVGMGVKVSYI